MTTVPLGPISVHRVGYGAMQLPGPGVMGPPRDHDEALAVLRRAVELGVDHVDTSQHYGPDVANEQRSVSRSCAAAWRTTCAPSGSTGSPRSTCG